MKAIICTNYGGPEVLQFTEIEKPLPKNNEILIKIRATTVTVADFRIRSFTVPKALWLPVRLAIGLSKPRKNILGVELAGEVEAIGKEGKLFKTGDQIFAATLKDFGAYAEYKCLPESDPIAIKPDNISFEEAAALPIGARTALYFLQQGNIKKGQKILVYGASGSVGTYAVQIAKHYGAEVTGVCSSKNFELIRSLGASKVIDYTSENFTDNLEKYDIVFLAIDKLPFSICNKVLKDTGVYINITNPIKSLHQIWITLTSQKKIIMGGNVPEKPVYLTKIKELVESGELKPIIDKIYNFDQIKEAHDYVGKGHKKGNVAIKVS